jgi:hypothetical protein
MRTVKVRILPPQPTLLEVSFVPEWPEPNLQTSVPLVSRYRLALFAAVLSSVLVLEYWLSEQPWESFILPTFGRNSSSQQFSPLVRLGFGFGFGFGFGLGFGSVRLIRSEQRWKLSVNRSRSAIPLRSTHASRRPSTPHSCSPSSANCPPPAPTGIRLRNTESFSHPYPARASQRPAR